jgi:hypothetical protein
MRAAIATRDLGDLTTIFRQKYAGWVATRCTCREQHIADAGLELLLDDPQKFTNRGSNRMVGSVKAAHTPMSFASVGTDETWRASGQFRGAVALAGGEVGVG